MYYVKVLGNPFDDNFGPFNSVATIDGRKSNV
jgi:hypothetical protein